MLRVLSACPAPSSPDVLHRYHVTDSRTDVREVVLERVFELYEEFMTPDATKLVGPGWLERADGDRERCVVKITKCGSRHGGHAQRELFVFKRFGSEPPLEVIRCAASLWVAEGNVQVLCLQQGEDVMGEVIASSEDIECMRKAAALHAGTAAARRLRAINPAPGWDLRWFRERELKYQDFFRDVCRGLVELHRRNIVHMDVCLENMVTVDRDGEARLRLRPTSAAAAAASSSSSGSCDVHQQSSQGSTESLTTEGAAAAAARRRPRGVPAPAPGSAEKRARVVGTRRSSRLHHADDADVGMPTTRARGGDGADAEGGAGEDVEEEGLGPCFGISTGMGMAEGSTAQQDDGQAVSAVGLHDGSSAQASAGRPAAGLVGTNAKGNDPSLSRDEYVTAGVDATMDEEQAEEAGPPDVQRLSPVGQQGARGAGAACYSPPPPRLMGEHRDSSHDGARPLTPSTDQGTVITCMRNPANPGPGSMSSYSPLPGQLVSPMTTHSTPDVRVRSGPRPFVCTPVPKQGREEGGHAAPPGSAPSKSTASFSSTHLRSILQGVGAADARATGVARSLAPDDTTYIHAPGGNLSSGPVAAAVGVGAMTHDVEESEPHTRRLAPLDAQRRPLPPPPQQTAVQQQPQHMQHASWPGARTPSPLPLSAVGLEASSDARGCGSSISPMPPPSSSMYATMSMGALQDGMGEAAAQALRRTNSDRARGMAGDVAGDEGGRGRARGRAAREVAARDEFDLECIDEESITCADAEQEDVHSQERKPHAAADGGIPTVAAKPSSGGVEGSGEVRSGDGMSSGGSVIEGADSSSSDCGTASAEAGAAVAGTRAKMRGALIDFEYARQQLPGSTTCLAPPKNGRVYLYAPEYLYCRGVEPGYDGRAVDMWALGVSMMVAITTQVPFDKASRSDKRYSAYLAASERRKSDGTPTRPRSARRLLRALRLPEMALSDELIDLVERLVDPEPTTRLTAEQCLEHPWLRGHMTNDVYQLISSSAYAVAVAAAEEE